MKRFNLSFKHILIDYQTEMNIFFMIKNGNPKYVFPLFFKKTNNHFNFFSKLNFCA